MLCEFYGMSQRDRSDRVQKVIAAALAASLEMQRWPKSPAGDRGGWRYVGRPVFGTDMDEDTLPAGAELLAVDGSGKTVGRITSAVQSPKRGGVLALAYVGRGVDRVLLDGREIRVPLD